MFALVSDPGRYWQDPDPGIFWHDLDPGRFWHDLDPRPLRRNRIRILILNKLPNYFVRKSCLPTYFK